jgi:putative transposase
MPRRAVQFCPGEYYHLYNRGNNRECVFFARENYLFFLRQWREYVSRVSDVVAYCLMPTHYHVLIQLKDKDLSHCLQLLAISYTKAINKSCQRVGVVFQGAFKARHIDRNEYLVHLSRYIHLNPVLAGLVKQVEDWEFSSYREYVSLRAGSLPVPGIVLLQFASPDAYRAFVAAHRPEERKVVEEFAFD